MRTPTSSQNGSRERGIGTLKYEALFLHDITDAVELADQAVYEAGRATARPVADFNSEF